MKTQINRRKVEGNASLDNTDLHPILRNVYLARGITQKEELDTELDKLLPFHDLIDIDKAVKRLYQALIKQEKVLIVGDFDADGATSTAVAMKALQAFGVRHVGYLVPNRFEYGYGLTPEIVAVAAKQEPDLIITVDNGISSIEGVNAANAVNIDVIVTDHHLPAETLPEAVAIVNPNQLGDPFASKSIAGVGVIFYVMLALRRELVQTGWFEEKGTKPVNMAQFLDLVALGTVADVVALDKNNRILVQQGLARIRHNRCAPGITALLEIASRQAARVVASDLGFAIGPRLNAAGRLDDMSLGIECLLSTNINGARQMARTLDDLNRERREIEASMQQEALQVLNKLHIAKAEKLPHGISLYQADWHQGVIGIIAGRIKDKYHRPVVAFANVNDIEVKGSARSVKGIHIRDVLAKINSDTPGLISKFGGHAMAAGLSMPAARFQEFSKLFDKEIERIMDGAEPHGEVLSDGELGHEDFTLDLAQLIRQSGPWGQQFPEPIFDGVFDIVQQRLVGKNHLKLVLCPIGASKSIDAIAFNVDLERWPNHRCQQVTAAFRLDVNEYQGKRTVQLMIEYFQEYEGAEVDVAIV